MTQYKFILCYMLIRLQDPQELSRAKFYSFPSFHGFEGIVGYPTNILFYSQLILC